MLRKEKSESSVDLLVLIPYLKMGGTERQAIRQVKYFHERGLNVKLVVAERKGGLLGAEPRGTIFLNRKFSKRNVPVLIIDLYRLLRRERPKALISRAWNTNFIAACAAFPSGVFCLKYISGNGKFGQRNFFKLIAEKFVYVKNGSFLALTDDAKKNFLRTFPLPPEYISVLPNGVPSMNVEQNSDLPESSYSEMICVGFLGSLIHRKGLDVLIRALSIIEDQLILKGRVKVKVIGDGPCRSEYETMVKALDVQKNFVFFGEHREPQTILRTCQIFVLPSRAEGFPNALLEAMALGLAPIAADCPTGPGDIIITSQNGYLFPVDDAGTLAGIIQRLYEDREQLAELRTKAQSTIKNKFLDSYHFDQLTEITGLVKRESK